MTASFEKNLELIDTIMFDSLGFFYIKDQDSNFIYANKAMLAYFGFYQQKEITGKSTYDLFPHHNAELLVKNDQIILEINEEKQFIEYFNNELSYFAMINSYKKPIYFDKKLIGIVAQSLKVPTNALQPTQELTPNNQFLDISAQRILDLSPRRREILFQTLKGLSSKDVAELLSLSSRTIENNIAAIKDANGYHSIKQLIRRIRMI